MCRAIDENDPLDRSLPFPRFLSLETHRQHVLAHAAIERSLSGRDAVQFPQRPVVGDEDDKVVAVVPVLWARGRLASRDDRVVRVMDEGRGAEEVCPFGWRQGWLSAMVNVLAQRFR